MLTEKDEVLSIDSFSGRFYVFEIHICDSFSFSILVCDDTNTWNCSKLGEEIF